MTKHWWYANLHEEAYCWWAKYDKVESAKTHEDLQFMLNYELRCVYDKITKSVLSGSNDLFFIYSYGGILGKHLYGNACSC